MENYKSFGTRQAEYKGERNNTMNVRIVLEEK